MTIDLRFFCKRNKIIWEKSRHTKDVYYYIDLIQNPRVNFSDGELAALISRFYPDSASFRVALHKRYDFEYEWCYPKAKKALYKKTDAIPCNEHLNIKNVQHKKAVYSPYGQDKVVFYRGEDKYDFATCLFLAARGNEYAISAYDNLDFSMSVDYSVVKNDPPSIAFFMKHFSSSLLLLENPALLGKIYVSLPQSPESESKMGETTFLVLEKLFDTPELYNKFWQIAQQTCANILPLLFKYLLNNKKMEKTAFVAKMCSVYESSLSMMNH